MLEVMQTLVVVAGQELAMAMSRDEDNIQITHLIRLISALQTSLLVWCWQQLTDQESCDQLKATASTMLVTCESFLLSVLGGGVGKGEWCKRGKQWLCVCVCRGERP